MVKGDKQNKFSKTESNRIVSSIEDYVQLHDLQIRDVCSNLRPSKSKQHHSIWKELHDMFPKRSKVCIYEHARRRLYKKYSTDPESKKASLTADEKLTLQRFVELKGNKWTEIAREMGKYDNDLKVLFTRLGDRINTGEYSIDENVALLRSVQRHTNTRGCSIADIPAYGIPWKAIARDMGDKRFPLDYERHWDNLKHVLLFGWGIEGVKKNDTQFVVKAATAKRQQMLGNLALSRAKSMVVLEELLAELVCYMLFYLFLLHHTCTIYCKMMCTMHIIYVYMYPCLIF